MNAQRGVGFVTWLIVIAVVLGGGYFLVSSGALRSKPEERVSGARVQRGPLRISVVEKGNLKAADYKSVRSELERRTTILYLIDEGTYVEEGELVCELDSAEFVERRVEQEISVRNAEAAFVKSKQTYEIQKSQNESDIARADQALTFAEEDLRKYKEGDQLLAEENAREAITLATEEHTRAQDKLEWSEKLAEKGFLTATELEGDRLSLTRASIQFDQAVREQRILVEYEIPRQIASLEADLVEAARELERVKLQAAARLVDFEADLSTNEAKLKLEQDELTKLDGQIRKTKLYAPKAGMVVYAQEEGGRWGNSEPMAEGKEIRERQEIITIPSAGGMIGEMSLHETFLKQVHAGQRCAVRVDALPDQMFMGEVSFVALLPDKNSYFANPNTRLYRTEIRIADASLEMRPGMSCSVEIIVEDLEDALYVPIQSVFRTRGTNICFVDRGGSIDTVEVETGLYNETWVQVLSGVEEGDVVLMSPPVDFEAEAEEDAPLEAPYWNSGDVSTGQPASLVDRGDQSGPGPGGGPMAGQRGDAQRGGGLDAIREAGGGEKAGGGERGSGGAPDMARIRESLEKREGRKLTDEEFKQRLESFRSSYGGGGGGGDRGDRGGGGRGGGRESRGSRGQDSSPSEQR